MDGYLCIDKPEGPGSFDIIKKLRSVLKIKKIGHSGTLDPLASGLLICAIGKATRLLEYIPHAPKEYRFSVQFGSTTDTLDREGDITESGKPLPSADSILSALTKFIGDISQVPPRFSAIKLKGKPAYEMARRKEKFALEARAVKIHSLQMHKYDDNSGVGNFSVSCSAGTYVRSLAADIARTCGTCGYAHSIRRTRIGPYTVEKALPFGKIQDYARECILPVKDFFSDYPSCIASVEQIMLLRNGRDIEMRLSGKPETVFVYDEQGDVVAVTSPDEHGLYHPVKVFGVQ